MQNGAGFIFSIANNNAIAVSAFSPPDSNIIFCNLFPVGCTLISISLSSTFSSFDKISSAFPPPNNSLNISLKFLLILLNFSLNCFFIADVISSIISLNFSIVVSRSIFWLFMLSYLSFVFLYSSIAETLTSPSSFIFLCISFTFCWVFCALLVFS